MLTCIDLEEFCGRKFDIQYEESYQAERGDAGRLHDPWLLTIPCRHGHIYPQGGEYLGASSNRRSRVANRLAALPSVRLVQDGDDGINVVFHVGAFDTVAEVMKPRRRRRLTPDQCAEQVERLRNYQFRPATRDAGDEHRRDPNESAA